MYSNERLFWNWAQVNCKFKSAGCQCPLHLLPASLRTQSQRLPAKMCDLHLLIASSTSRNDVWLQKLCVTCRTLGPLLAAYLPHPAQLQLVPMAQAHCMANHSSRQRILCFCHYMLLVWSSGGRPVSGKAKRAQMQWAGSPKPMIWVEASRQPFLGQQRVKK